MTTYRIRRIGEPRGSAGRRGMPAPSRRQVLGMMGALAAGPLAACGTQPGGAAAGGPTPTTAPPVAVDRSDDEPVLTFDNWPLYIDSDEDDPNVRPTLRAFEEETGISVEYVEAVNDNDEYFARISPQLSAGQPIGATHKKNAELLMNHYYKPEIAAELAAWVWFISPVPAAKEAMAEVDPDLVDEWLIFPTAEDLANTGIARDLTADEEENWTAAWNAIVGA